MPRSDPRADCVRSLLLYLADAVPAARPGRFQLRRVLAQEPLKDFPPDLVYAVAREFHTRRYFTIAPSQRPGVSPDLIPPERYCILSMTEKGLVAAQKLRDDTVWHAARERSSAAARLALPVLLDKLLDHAPALLDQLPLP